MYSKLYSAIFLLFIALFNASVSSAQCNPTTSVSVNVDITGTNAQISWPAVAGAVSYDLFVGLSPSSMPPSTGITNITSSSTTITSLSPFKKYDICIRTHCSSGVSNWFCDTFWSYTTNPCPPPTQVVASATGPHTGTASWLPAAGVQAHEYSVWVSVPPPNAGWITTTTNSMATLSGLKSLGTHYFWVRSSCAGSTHKYSTWVSDTMATPKALTIDEIDNGQIKVYPNPATDKFYIETGATVVSEIQLTDIYGKVLLRSSLQAKERKEIDMSSFAKGLYILTYETSTGPISRKIQKL